MDRRSYALVSVLVACASPRSAEPAEPRALVTEDEARAELRAFCEARCGTIFDRDELVRRIVVRMVEAAAEGPPSAEEQALLDGHGVSTAPPTAEDQERFMSFGQGGPGVVVWAGYTLDVNVDPVELDGRFGHALFIDGENRVVACMRSDPTLLPTAVRVDC